MPKTLQACFDYILREGLAVTVQRVAGENCVSILDLNRKTEAACEGYSHTSLLNALTVAIVEHKQRKAERAAGEALAIVRATPIETIVRLYNGKEERRVAKYPFQRVRDDKGDA